MRASPRRARDRRIDRPADFALGVRADRVALVPCALDERLRARSFVVPQNRLEPFADIADAIIDDRLVITVIAALGAIVDPHRRHAERFGRREVADHVVDHERARRIDSELVDSSLR